MRGTETKQGTMLSLLSPEQRVPQKHPLRAVKALAEAALKDRRFARLGALYAGPRVNLQAVGAAFHIRKHGEDPRFSGSPLRVPANVLRDRAADVLSPRDLARRTYASFATAWQAEQDFEILEGSRRKKGRGTRSTSNRSAER